MKKSGWIHQNKTYSRQNTNLYINIQKISNKWEDGLKFITKLEKEQNLNEWQNLEKGKNCGIGVIACNRS